jgi:predicted transcriptional regulator
MPEVKTGKVKPIADGASAPIVIGKLTLRLYMRGSLTLVKYAKSREDAEAAAAALRALGVAVEAKGGGGSWHVVATIGMLATAAPELKEAVAKAIREAAEAGLIPRERAAWWLGRLEAGRGRPRYCVMLTKKKALMVRYMTTNLSNLEREAQRLREAGLVEGFHFIVTPPEGGRPGYIYIRVAGLRRIAATAARGNPAAAEFINLILQRAGEVGPSAYEKAMKIVEEAKALGSRRLSDVRGVEVEVGGKRHVVAVLSYDVEWDVRRLQISILAEVDGVDSWFTVTFSRRRRGRRAAGSAYGRASAPGGAEADAERFAALMKALTGKEPRFYVVGGRLVFSLGRSYLDALAKYAELADIIEGWLAASWLR